MGLVDYDGAVRRVVSVPVPVVPRSSANYSGFVGRIASFAKSGRS